MSRVPLKMMDEDYRPGPGTVLVFCCSGAADVGEIGHQAARMLDDRGVASRFCLAGIGGQVDAMLRKTREADQVLAIDGCKVGCASRTLECAGIKNALRVRVSDLGFAKGNSPPTPQRLAAVADRAQETMASANSKVLPK